MKFAPQRIPTDLWRKLTPSMFRARALVPLFWRAFIEARWDKFDTYIEELETILAEFKEARAKEPFKDDEENDSGW